MADPRGDDPGDGEQHAAPQPFGKQANARYAPVEQQDGEQTGSHRDPRSWSNHDGRLQRPQQRNHGAQVPLEKHRAEVGPQVARIGGESNAAGSDGEGRTETQLPDEKERGQTPQAAGAVHLLEIFEGAAGSGDGSAELSPDETVAHGQRGAQDPAEDGLRAVHGQDDKRKGHKRADADHVQHVQCDGAAQTHAAEQFGWGRRGGWCVRHARCARHLRLVMAVGGGQQEPRGVLPSKPGPLSFAGLRSRVKRERRQRWRARSHSRPRSAG